MPIKQSQNKFIKNLESLKYNSTHPLHIESVNIQSTDTMEQPTISQPLNISSYSDTDDSLVSSDISSYIASGINNIQAQNCWISSFLQMIYNIDDFRTDLLQLDISQKDIDKIVFTEQNISNKSNAEFILHIVSIIKSLHQSNLDKTPFYTISPDILKKITFCSTDSDNTSSNIIDSQYFGDPQSLFNTLNISNYSLKNISGYMV